MNYQAEIWKEDVAVVVGVSLFLSPAAELGNLRLRPSLLFGECCIDALQSVGRSEQF